MKQDNILDVAKKLKIAEKKIPLSAFKKGLKVEMEHKDVTGGDLNKTGKIALVHLLESKKYYDKLAKVEKTFKKAKRGVKKGRRLSSE